MTRGIALAFAMVMFVIMAAEEAWAQCRHLQEAIEAEEQAQRNDFSNAMASTLAGATVILPNCRGYDCLLATERNNANVSNQYNSESARHETRLQVLRPRLDGCQQAVQTMEGWIREAKQEERVRERTPQ